MISRRSLLQRGATATALAGIAVATVQCEPTPAPAAELDPIFAAIERHRASRVHLNMFEWGDDGWNAASDGEEAAWDAFAQTAPTTLAGLAAMTEYALHSPAGWEEGNHEGNLREVFRTVATVTAKLALDAQGGSA